MELRLEIRRLDHILRRGDHVSPELILGGEIRDVSLKGSLKLDVELRILFLHLLDEVVKLGSESHGELVRIGGQRGCNGVASFQLPA